MEKRNDEKIYDLATVVFKYLLLFSAFVIGGRTLFKDSRGFRNSLRLFVSNPIKYRKTTVSEGNYSMRKFQEFSAMIKLYFNQTKKFVQERTNYENANHPKS